MDLRKSSSSTLGIENLPHAGRVFEALRNIGYSLNAAVADVVDNSISAKAKIIKIDFFRVNKQFTLRIADNGDGMTKKKLIEAMRLGSEVEYSDNDLGKFGMGLKTASLGQCRKLTVASHAKEASDIHAYQWDIDFINHTNEWKMLKLPWETLKSEPRLNELKESSGTVVIWEHMDKFDSELASYATSAAADNYVGRLINELKLYLRMTFHRFLDNSLGKESIVILFNGKSLEPWDPFCRNEQNTKQLKSLSHRLSESKSEKDVLIEPFVLPVKEGPGGFSSIKAWDEAKGLLSWNDSQGYYIYRANRLIHFGGWLRTRAKDEHTKYARIAISFDKEHDDAFNIAVHKTKIQLPASLFDKLKYRINPKVIEAAQAPYRAKNKNTVKRDPVELWVKKTTVTQEKKVENEANKDNRILIPIPHSTVTTGNEVPIKTGGEVLRLNLRGKFGIQLGIIEDGKLWHLTCKPDGSFVVVLNKEHDFYKRSYEGHEENVALSNFMNSVLFAMAYAELYSASKGSKWLFEEIRDTISEVLGEVANKET